MTALQIQPSIRSDIDLFSDDVLNNPFPYIKQLRDLGPVAYLNKYDMWFVSRYEETRTWVRDWKSFSSAAGAGLNDTINKAWSEALISEDPPVHTMKRKFFDIQLGPKAMEPLRDIVEKRADLMVDALIEKGVVDAVRDIGQDLPINIVMDLIGWPEHVRPRIFDLAAGSFNALGPEGNPRTQESMIHLVEIAKVAEEVFDADGFTPGTWGAQLSAQEKTGAFTKEAVCGLLQGYIVAAFDTTVYGISNGVWLFAENPEQWDTFRENPAMCNEAFLEILRLESPLQHFSRVTTKDFDAGDGIVIPKGNRVIFSYAGANRDERAFENPDVFDIKRKPKPNFAFGVGIHTCAGQGLARLEATGVFAAMAKRIKRFELVGEAKRNLNNVARGFASIPVKIIT